MGMFSLMAASLTLVSTTPDCRIGLASDLIVSPLSTPGHYHPESRVEPGTVTHFFTSGSPQWGFAADGDGIAARPASGGADLSRLHLRAMHLGCDVAANRAELESQAQRLETLKTSEDWSRLGRAYIAILLYEIYAAIDADGGERERLTAELDTIAYNDYEAGYFRALTSVSDTYPRALAAIEARDLEAYRTHLITLAESHDRIGRQSPYDYQPYQRPGGNLQDTTSLGAYPLHFVRIAIVRLNAARLRVLGEAESGGMPWHLDEIAIFDDLFEGDLPQPLADAAGDLATFAEFARRSGNLPERTSGRSVFSTLMYAIGAQEGYWAPPYLYSPYLWAQYQLAEFEMISALHDLRYDPDATEAEIEAGILPFNHNDYTCAAEARYEAARDVLDGLFDLEPITPSRCEPVVADRVLTGIE
ncbi:MAG: hypothetical protein ACQRW7_06145 [Caulobacterales bacterium]|uniref:hypothetical protein n=1 Tax=Glycocaulis sp. TaxID=1969725 RepID=UPI003F9FA2C9